MKCALIPQLAATELIAGMHGGIRLLAGMKVPVACMAQGSAAGECGEALADASRRAGVEETEVVRRRNDHVQRSS